MLSLLLIVGMMWMLVKKMPALIQGLLQGNPSLSAGDMMGTLTGAMNTAGSVAGRVSAAMGGGGGGGDAGGGGDGGGGGSGGPNGQMQKLKDAASTAALAATTGGAGAAAKVAAQKGLKGALQRGAKKAQQAASAVKSGANKVGNGIKAADQKASSVPVAGFGYRAVKGMGKAGLQTAVRNLPGMKGFYEGRQAYNNNKDLMKSPSQKQRETQEVQAQQRHSNLSDMREGLGALARSMGGEDAEKKFQQEFDESLKFQPAPFVPTPPPKQGNANAPQESSGTSEDASKVRDLKTENRDLKTENSGLKMDNTVLRNAHHNDDE